MTSSALQAKTYQEMRDVMREIDQDSDGRISLMEWLLFEFNKTLDEPVTPLSCVLTTRLMPPTPPTNLPNGMCACEPDCTHRASSTDPPLLHPPWPIWSDQRYPAADRIADVVLAFADVIIV